MKNFNVLKQLRLISGFAQQEIADGLKIERSTYSKWETKEKDLTLKQIIKIAEFYGIGNHSFTKMMLDGFVSSPDVLAGIIRKK